MILFIVGAGGFLLGFGVAALVLGRKIRRLKLDVYFLKVERDLRKGGR